MTSTSRLLIIVAIAILSRKILVEAHLYDDFHFADLEYSKAEKEDLKNYGDIKMEKELHEVKASLDDLLFILGSALRYGLGRQSYAPDLIAGVIKDNLELLNEKWTINLLRDIKDYEQYRDEEKNKNDYNHKTWMDLKEHLLKRYNERGYTFPI